MAGIYRRIRADILTGRSAVKTKERSGFKFFRNRKMEINLKDIGGTAGSSVSLIIACTIFLHQLITKFVSSADRLRVLTQEYREYSEDDARKASLADQITLYYHRTHWIRHALCTVAIGEFFFILVIIASCLSVLMPASNAVGIIGLVALFLGLAAIAVGTAIEIYENYYFKFVIDSELSDFPELPQKTDKEKDANDES
jgi:uncharacterized protein DUF2721